MRKILFRGTPMSDNKYYEFSKIWAKQCENGFVYGSLIVSKNKCFICVSTVGIAMNCCINNSTISMIEVDPNTIGQYTGLTDKYGIRIFEGDIVRLYGDENNPDTKMIDYNALVIFKSGRFCAVDGTEDNHSFERLIFNSYLNCEVIGNKYDNPELLEVSK